MYCLRQQYCIVLVCIELYCIVFLFDCIVLICIVLYCVVLSAERSMGLAQRQHELYKPLCTRTQQQQICNILSRAPSVAVGVQATMTSINPNTRKNTDPFQEQDTHLQMVSVLGSLTQWISETSENDNEHMERSFHNSCGQRNGNMHETNRNQTHNK